MAMDQPELPRAWAEDLLDGRLPDKLRLVICLAGQQSPCQ